MPAVSGLPVPRCAALCREAGVEVYITEMAPGRLEKVKPQEGEGR